MPNIKVENLSVTYLLKKNEIPALKDVSCEFENNKIHAIIGSSGSGKTTLFRAICHSLEYDGNIYFNNIDILSKDKKDLNIAYVSQEFILYPNLTIYENLAFPLKILKLDDEEIDRRVLDVAYLLKLLPCLTRLPKHISLGQQQRVALGRALIKIPDVLILDEPFSNLDKALVKELLPLLKKIINIKKITCLYSSHDLIETMTISDKFYFFDEGKLVYSGRKSEMLKTKNKVVIDILKGSGLYESKKKRL